MDAPTFCTQPHIIAEELHIYHRFDRELFCFLTFKLERNVSLSLLVMAMWIWLEKVGYPNLIRRVMNESRAVITDVADEGEMCLQCLEIDDLDILDGGDLPVTKMLMQKDISLRFFNLKRYTAIAGIKDVLNNVCARIFNDVLQLYLKKKNTIELQGTTLLANARNMPLVLPGFPHPLFGTFDLSPRIETISLSNQSIWRQETLFDASDDDRSMFLTFSRGACVSEMDVMHLFTYLYGDCVTWLTMGENPEPTNQPFFAIMILKSVTTVDQILEGKRVVKLYINKKPIWVRKFKCGD